MRVSVFVALLALCTGCAHTHLERNAPGVVDVQTRPRTANDRIPQDPGESMLTMSYGGLGGGGVVVHDGAEAYGELGVELSLLRGIREVSHYDDDFVITPDRAFGASVGWNGLTSQGEGVGPLYAEFALRAWMFAGMGLGWAWDVDDNQHGPQATLSLGPFYARVGHQFGQGTALSAGIVLKNQHSWIWSR